MQADTSDTIGGLQPGLKALAGDVLGPATQGLLGRALTILSDSGVTEPAQVNRANIERIRGNLLGSGTDAVEADRLASAMDIIRRLALVHGHISALGALTELLESDLDPISKAERVREFRELRGDSLRGLARSGCVELTRASRLMALLKLPEPVRQLVRDGRIPEASAVEIARRVGDLAVEELVDLAHRVASGELDSRDLGRQRREILAEQGRDRRITKPVILLKQNRKAVVLGVTKRLTAAQYLVISALMESYPQGQSMADMERRREEYEAAGIRGFGGWWQTLAKLKSSDPEWGQVLRFPNDDYSGLGYRIVNPADDSTGSSDTSVGLKTG